MISAVLLPQSRLSVHPLPPHPQDAALSLTLSAELIFDGLDASFLLDEVVDDFGGLLVLQLGLGDAAHIEEVLQIRVQVVHLDKEEGPRVKHTR